LFQSKLAVQEGVGIKMVVKVGWLWWNRSHGIYVYYIYRHRHEH